MSIYFWSDTHFNHTGIIKYCKRPYADVAEMNLAMMAQWNRTVKPNDTIWFVGDFGFHAKHEGTTPLDEIFSNLSGHKNLVIGNHDEKNPKVLALPWEKKVDLVTVRDEGGRRAMVCHYPMETWKQAHHGYLMIHGHSHGSLKTKLPHRFDVGVDVEPVPVRFEELWERAQAQTFSPVDHHGEDM